MKTKSKKLGYSSNVIYDTHNNTEDNIIYKANKGKYIRHFNSLGEHDEKILNTERKNQNIYDQDQPLT